MATIFAADENALVVNLMSVFLTEDGHSFFSADGLAGLLELLGNQDESPDLLVLSADLEPGFLSEVIFDLRGATGDITPVLVTLPSGVAQMPDEIQGIASVSVLRKPFDSDTFMAQIRSLLLPTAPTEPPEEKEEEEQAPESERSSDDAGSAGMDVEGLQSLSTAALNELIRVWLADQGRLIMEHEARRALEESSAKMVEEIAWKVVPEMAEDMLRAEIRRLTEDLEN